MDSWLYKNENLISYILKLSSCCYFHVTKCASTLTSVFILFWISFYCISTINCICLSLVGAGGDLMKQKFPSKYRIHRSLHFLFLFTSRKKHFSFPFAYLLKASTRIFFPGTGNWLSPWSCLFWFTSGCTVYSLVLVSWLQFQLHHVKDVGYMCSLSMVCFED